MKPSLFSVSYAGLWGQSALDLPRFIAHAAELGYPSVMLMGKRPHLSPLDATPHLLASIKEALDVHRVRCDVIAAYTDFRPGTAAEVPNIELQIAYVESLARIAAELGASVVRVFTAYESDGHDFHAAWRRVVEAIQETCDRAGQYGVTVAIQNHHDLALHTDALLELLADIDRPNCRLAFDAWSPALRGENLAEAARRAAPRVAITTNADYVRLPRYAYRPQFVNYERLQPDWVRAVPFGTGCIDYAAFFKALREGGFNGIAAYEMCSPVRGGGSLANLDAYAAAYLEWMSRHESGCRPEAVGQR
ncbi:MAG: sugar phosphate isomerase/epimerase family protein [Pirellulales bacterium]